MRRPLEFHTCKDCKVTFRSSREFEAHECVKQLEELSLDQLMAMYQARK